MKPSRNLFLGSLLLVAAAIGLHTTARAAILTWDADAGTMGSQDGGGTWPKEATVGPTTSAPDVNGVTITIDTDTTPASNAAAGKVFARLIATQP